MIAHSRRVAAAFLATGLLAGCGDGFGGIFGGSEAPPLPGERLAVLDLERTLTPDPRIAGLEVRLPRPAVNPHWPQAGGYASHSMQHLGLRDGIRPIWTIDVGSDAGAKTRILSSPVVASGLLFAMDARTNVAAYSAGDGKPQWRRSLRAKGEESGEFGGGLAYSGTMLYVATGYGEVLAINPGTGNTVWKQSIGLPIRAEPTVSSGLVFVVSYDNQLFALSTEDGRVVWNHVGIAEVAGLIGAANPAAAAGVVVAPYSSGELFALRAENGRMIWSDSLQRRRRIAGVSDLGDINGRPVIDRGIVYAISHAGRMVAIDLRTGERLWDQDLAGVQTPWVVGDFIFLITVDNQLVCLSRREGRIRWVTPLARFEDVEDKENPIQWYGPVLAGDRLLLVSSHGRAVAVSPYTGRVLGQEKLDNGAVVAPVVANGMLYIMDEDAIITAWR